MSDELLNSSNVWYSISVISHAYPVPKKKCLTPKNELNKWTPFVS